jgi:hypothetical protein
MIVEVLTVCGLVVRNVFADLVDMPYNISSLMQQKNEF